MRDLHRKIMSLNRNKSSIEPFGCTQIPLVSLPHLNFICIKKNFRRFETVNSLLIKLRKSNAQRNFLSENPYTQRVHPRSCTHTHSFVDFYLCISIYVCARVCIGCLTVEVAFGSLYWVQVSSIRGNILFSLFVFK